MEQSLKLIYRPAEHDDVPELIALLADDPLGATREDPSLPPRAGYLQAFQAINSDPNNVLVVVTADGPVIGMLQLTFIPYLTYGGSWRCLIEGVRIHSEYRGKGLGRHFIQHAIERAQQRECRLVQLTSDKRRKDAFRFYESLGFKASHEGFKLHLR